MNMKREIVKLSVETDYKLEQSFKEEDRFREKILIRGSKHERRMFLSKERNQIVL